MKISSEADGPGLRYLLDTNIVSALVQAPDGALAQHISSLPQGACAISLVVAAELRYGLVRKGSPRLTQKVEAVMASLNALPLESPVDQHYGEIRAALSTLGQSIGQNDLFIAAHARALNVVLITANEREFARVPGLKIENWMAAVDN